MDVGQAPERGLPQRFVVPGFLGSRRRVSWVYDAVRRLGSSPGRGHPPSPVRGLGGRGRELCADGAHFANAGWAGRGRSGEGTGRAVLGVLARGRAGSGEVG
ncbi:hypothetical protein DUI70_2648 [Streptomyces albus]|nr:hypothetical protein SLNHY_2684 [Streptomyces albus]AYN33149.1 hypothetical protein DUI70_2648 [Streptomyces albus]